ncbi:MarP family serine protease [Paramicrobacterium agarici]|uniref:Colicin V production protein n=1 Tax=Paramicrobacterium agarici TaxID=630514 RepID=A0A2A9DZZ0_9MICO|nr:MarP family serine protease [Microbacterium agarici]PFG31901.1 colicin V production protein [Microbacterium agarici]
MTAGIIVDVILVVILLVAVIGGWQRGMLHTIGAIAGMIVGGIVALLVMPLVSGNVPAAGWNVVLAVACGIILVGLGISLGSWLGKLIAGPVRKIKLGIVDRLLGAVVSGIVALLVVMTLGMSTSTLGLPTLTQAMASSTLLKTLENATPTPVLGAISQFRSLVITDGIPSVLDAAGIPDNIEIPDANTDSPALHAAAQSVTRITANAPACGTRSAGSGFVIDDGLVMTNAHVVAGASDVVVETPGELPRAGSVVYFDADADIAVIDVDGLGAEPLPFNPTPDAGATVFFQGYPFGGPFVSRSAAVVNTGDMTVSSIYGEPGVTRSVTTLAAHVQHGNSGGPLLDKNGAVVGMIFAKADNQPDVGFALSMAELSPVLAQAGSFSSPVSTESCSTS